MRQPNAPRQVTPRNFALHPSGDWLLVGNAGSDNITVFAVDKADGTLARRGTCEVAGPICITFVPAPPRSQL
jgi:6-phosphogluconolactonase